MRDLGAFFTGANSGRAWFKMYAHIMPKIERGDIWSRDPHMR